MVRVVGFEPTNPYGTAAAGLRRWPGLATPACVFFYILFELRVYVGFVCWVRKGFIFCCLLVLRRGLCCLLWMRMS